MEERRHFFWTETPIAAMWQQVRYLRSPTNVARLLSGEISSGRRDPFVLGPVLNQRAEEISACIRQADDYFRAADTIGLTTKPLLLFYGVEALAKALILASSDPARQPNLRYHGLDTRPRIDAADQAEALSNYVNDPTQWRIEDEFALTNDGVFAELVRVVEQREPGDRAVVRLGELLRIIPELADLYGSHFGRPANTLYLSEYEVTTDGYLRVYLGGSLGGPFDRIFPELADQFDAERQGWYPDIGQGWRRSRDPVGLHPPFARIVDGTLAGHTLVRPLSCGLFHPLTVGFAALHIVSNVVRYKPALWMKEVEGLATGSASLIEALCEFVKRRLPNDVLEGIWHERFAYGTPGYMA